MEEQALPQEQFDQQGQVEQSQPQAELPNPFLETSWADPSQPDTGFDSQFPQQDQYEDEYEEEIVDADEWLQNQFGWENADQAKAELEELRQLRESAETEAEIEFANEQSAKFFRLMQEGKEDELYSFLESKKKLDRLVSADLNRDTAAEIIKLNMQQKYRDLTPDEIEYKFKKQFSIPSKPVQQDIETDFEYEERVLEWENRVKDVETEMFIEAKLARPELEKYKNELVLPEVEFENGPTQISQEELEVREAILDEYYNAAQRALDEFDSLSVMVKDAEVEIPLSYNLSFEEKSFIAEKLESFAENNLDANAILADRWVTEDGQIDTKQIIEDLAILYSEGRIGQKFANEAAAKRLSEHMRRSSNVSLNSRTAQNTFGEPSNKTDLEKQIDFIWKNG